MNRRNSGGAATTTANSNSSHDDSSRPISCSGCRIEHLLLHPHENPLLIVDWAVTLDEQRQEQQQQQQVLNNDNRSRSAADGWLLRRLLLFRFQTKDEDSLSTTASSSSSTNSSTGNLLTEPLEQGRLHGTASRALFRQALEYVLVRQQQQQQQQQYRTTITTSKPATSFSSTNNKAITPIILSGLLIALQEYQEQQQQQANNNESATAAATANDEATRVREQPQSQQQQQQQSPINKIISSTELVWYCHYARRTAINRIHRRRQFKVWSYRGAYAMLLMVAMGLTMRAVRQRCLWMEITWQMMTPSDANNDHGQCSNCCMSLPPPFQDSCRMGEARLLYTYQDSPPALLQVQSNEDATTNTGLHYKNFRDESFAFHTPWTRPHLIDKSEVLGGVDVKAAKGGQQDDKKVEYSVLFSFISLQLEKLQNSSSTSTSTRNTAPMDMLDVGCGIGAWLYHFLSTTTTTAVQSASSDKNAASTSWSYHGIAASRAQVNLARRLWNYTARGMESQKPADSKSPQTLPRQVWFEQPQLRIVDDKSGSLQLLALPRNQYSLILVLDNEIPVVSTANLTASLVNLISALRRRQDVNDKMGSSFMKKMSTSTAAAASHLVLLQEYLLGSRRRGTTAATEEKATMAAKDSISTTTRAAWHGGELYTYSEWKQALRRAGCHVDFAQDMTFQFELKQRRRQGWPHRSTNSKHRAVTKRAWSVSTSLLVRVWEFWASLATAGYATVTGDAAARRWSTWYFYEKGMVQREFQKQKQRYNRQVLSSSSSSSSSQQATSATSHFLLICHV